MRTRVIDQKCDYCEYICDDRAQLKLHQSRTDGTGKTVYECYDCEYTTPRSDTFKKHSASKVHKGGSTIRIK